MHQPYTIKFELELVVQLEAAVICAVDKRLSCFCFLVQEIIHFLLENKHKKNWAQPKTVLS